MKSAIVRLDLKRRPPRLTFDTSRSPLAARLLLQLTQKLLCSLTTCCPSQNNLFRPTAGSSCSLKLAR